MGDVKPAPTQGGAAHPEGAEGASATAPSPGPVPRPSQSLLVIGMIAFSLGVFVLAELFSAPHGGGAAPAERSTDVEVSSRDHVVGRTQNRAVPPVGGDHAPVWQNCGFYERAVPIEAALHSLEHGAVWVTYRQGLDPAELDHLRRLSASGSKVLVSLWEGNLSTPLMASAWGSQRRLTSASDPELADFVRRFQASPQPRSTTGPAAAARDDGPDGAGGRTGARAESSEIGRLRRLAPPESGAVTKGATTAYSTPVVNRRSCLWRPAVPRGSGSAGRGRFGNGLAGGGQELPVTWKTPRQRTQDRHVDAVGR